MTILAPLAMLKWEILAWLRLFDNDSSLIPDRYDLWTKRLEFESYDERIELTRSDSSVAKS